jgi:hypothetical protein
LGFRSEPTPPWIRQRTSACRIFHDGLAIASLKADFEFSCISFLGEAMNKILSRFLIGIVALGLSLSKTTIIKAQNMQIQERLTEIKEAAARNKQVLAQYAWQEQQTVSIKGDVKKRQLFRVMPGPDGKPQKTEISSSAQQPSGDHRRFGLRGKIEEKKKEEFKDYAEQIAALAQSYARQDPGRLQQLFQQGNVTIGSTGMPDEVQIVIHNYMKENDSVTLYFNRSQKALKSIEVTSYLSEPEDAVNISAQYEKEPDGPNHVSIMTVDGVKKQLTVRIQNNNYQRM